MQPDLFAAAGDASRRPTVTALVPRLKSALNGRGWVSGRVLCAELGTNPRSLREAGNKSHGEVVGHQRGYALTVQASLGDIVAVVKRHLSQSREQKRRAMEIERVRHGACGDLGTAA